MPDAFDGFPNNPDTDGDRILDGFELARNGTLNAPVTLGDVNGDGTVDQSDVALLGQIASGDSELPAGVDVRDADVDGDGQVTENDATLLQGWIDGDPELLPAVAGNGNANQLDNPQGPAQEQTNENGPGVIGGNGFQQLLELPAGPQQEFTGMFDPADWAGTGLNIN
ncbi:MAG: hypothetical protein ACI9MU_004276 [Alphaproteobacteria bacterium]